MNRKIFWSTVALYRDAIVSKAMARAMVSEFVFLSAAVYVSVLAGLVIDGVTIKSSFHWEILKVATVASTYFVVLRLCISSVSGVIFVDRMSRYFQLESFGRRGRGFRRSVELAGDFATFVAQIDAILKEHRVVSRVIAGDRAEWVPRISGFRYRLTATKADRGSAVIAIEPVSDWIRYYVVPAEGHGAAAISGILWRVLTTGVARFDVDRANPPRNMHQELELFYKPRVWQH